MFQFLRSAESAADCCIVKWWPQSSRERVGFFSFFLFVSFFRFNPFVWPAGSAWLPAIRGRQLHTKKAIRTDEKRSERRALSDRSSIVVVASGSNLLPLQPLGSGFDDGDFPAHTSTFTHWLHGRLPGPATNRRKTGSVVFSGGCHGRGSDGTLSSPTGREAPISGSSVISSRQIREPLICCSHRLLEAVPSRAASMRQIIRIPRRHLDGWPASVEGREVSGRPSVHSGT